MKIVQRMKDRFPGEIWKKVVYWAGFLILVGWTLALLRLLPEEERFLLLELFVDFLPERDCAMLLCSLSCFSVGLLYKRKACRLQTDKDIRLLFYHDSKCL